ncbi:MAG: hypothetical protein MJZ98_01225 [Paludibacteraceae bacterium]|nr:hypothetical protein [Paludibacteraceae bacterium]
MSRNKKLKPLTPPETSRAKAKRIAKQLNKKWEFMEQLPKYKYAAAKENFYATTNEIKEEVLDGIFFSLSDSYMSKSAKVQQRIVRRIVEKRVAQANHHSYGRSHDLFCAYQEQRNTSRCMESINRHRHAC